MEFKNLAIYLSRLEATASRNKITEILAELFQKASEKEIDKICYLCLGKLAPVYAGLDFNLAEKLMIRVISKAFGIPEEKIKREYKRIGDLGELTATIKRIVRTSNLSVNDVYKRLYEIAIEGGEGSVERKINKTAALLDDLDALSVRYVVRIPLGKLRLGFSELTILDALSWLLAGDKSKRQEIEAAFDVQADIGQIAKIIKSKKIKGLKAVKIQFGVPVMPALCQRLPNVEEIIKKMGKVAVEPKYDGTRLQIHWSKKKVSFFTRNLENVTQMFPDLAEA
ncbi:DNA ligase, partial [Patescibacteria group bacterium]|nr:DNA ligase [Patescibacteria group bacterium]